MTQNLGGCASNPPLPESRRGPLEKWAVPTPWRSSVFPARDAVHSVRTSE